MLAFVLYCSPFFHTLQMGAKIIEFIFVRYELCYKSYLCFHSSQCIHKHFLKVVFELLMICKYVI